MFLFSATFFPLSTYPGWLQAVVQVTPLYHAVSLLRGLTTGAVGAAQLVDVAYLAVARASAPGSAAELARIAKLLCSPERRRRAPLRRGSPAPPLRPRWQADAAEVVVQRRPAAHRAEPRPLQLGEGVLVDAGLGVDDVAGAVEARPLDRRDAGRAPRRGSRPRRRRAPSAAACRRPSRSRARPRRRRARGSAPSCSPSARPARAAPGRGRPRRACCSGAGRGRAGSRRCRGPRLVVSTQARPSASAVTRFVVSPSSSGPPSSASRSACTRSRSARGARRRRQAGSDVGHAGEAPRASGSVCRRTPARPARSSGLVARQVVAP